MGDAMRRNKKKAEELEADGWDALGIPEVNLGGNLSAAEDYFRKALIYDPDLADAFNGLGTVFYRHQRLAEAEAMYRTALEKARHDLGSDKPRACNWWGDISTRPYMRARHNLGLVFWRQGKYADAIGEFKELLRRNSYDNQGIRYLIGGIYHLSGNLPEAMSYYRQAGASRFGQLDPATEFNYGLALFQTAAYTKAVLEFRVSFFLNLYLPQVVLHEAVRPYRIWHGTNLAEPSYALDYWGDYSRLWKTCPDATAFVRMVYEDEAVHSEIRSFVQIKERLLAEKDISARGPLVDEELRIQNQKRLKTTNPAIASRVVGRFQAG
jgi:tetratricopeptide (TPR) repeat protein